MSKKQSVSPDKFGKTLDMGKIKLVNDQTYKMECRYYELKGTVDTHRWEQFMFNAVSRYLETGDTTHINRVLHVSVQRKVFRNTYRIIKDTLAVLIKTSYVTPHKWSAKHKQYLGKAEKIVLKKSRDAFPESFHIAMNNEKKHQTKEPEFDWNKKQKLIIKQLETAVQFGAVGKRDAENALKIMGIDHTIMAVSAEEIREEEILEGEIVLDKAQTHLLVAGVSV